ncbi:MAG: hypothetical protein HYY96_04065 [Candidatus Tectomicrobia bacterium]|nr:hypothetical protein [Candidatus Tectomicrobia bacterium]
MFEYLIPLLLFGGLMFLMHRFGMGCGSHSHGGKHGEGQHHHDTQGSEGAPRVAASSCCGGAKPAAEVPQVDEGGKRLSASPAPAEELDGQKPIVRS